MFPMSQGMFVILVPELIWNFIAQLTIITQKSTLSYQDLHY